MDRRIYKTKRAIMEAFVGLLEEQEFEKITIQAIADRADVNRGTVYAHFTDKYDLLEQCMDTYLKLLYESCKPDEESSKTAPEALLLRTFEFLERHASVYSTLITSKGTSAFQNRMVEIMGENIKGQLSRRSLGTNIRPEILVHFLSVAIAGLVEWWIVKGLPYTPSEMVDQLMLIMERNLNVRG
ncbi:TetR/AcrR family transcriptional regulator [Xylanibacillus composti]|uniref:TetR family transcriptional regulator n=1 Tax=Xylanibacillus composti TaxID=1572762 RepID=A0A8J4M3V8_9BACL|nr:TetR/AcrR family transcriptional regulator [Xylanibacillus composti]GIQ70490.1 TetR family transcriptional regulator [Xylanibacillus composti]